MKATYVLSKVKAEVPGVLKVNDIIQYPFKHGRLWTVTAVDEEHDRVTLED